MAATATKSRKPAAKSKAPPKPTMLNLKYYDKGGTLQYSYFTVGERETALAIAAAYDAKGLRPRLYSATYDGDFTTLYDYESRAKKAAAAARKVKPVKAAA